MLQNFNKLAWYSILCICWHFSVLSLRSTAKTCTHPPHLFQCLACNIHCMWLADVYQGWRYLASLSATSAKSLHQSALNHQPALNWAYGNCSTTATPPRWLGSCQQRGDLDHHLKQMLRPCLAIVPSQGKAYHLTIDPSLAAGWWLVGRWNRGLIIVICKLMLFSTCCKGEMISFQSVLGFGWAIAVIVWTMCSKPCAQSRDFSKESLG